MGDEIMSEFAEIRRKLESRLHQLEARVDRIQEHLRKPGHPDFAERATETENDEVLEALDEAEGRELEQVRLALRRLEHGPDARDLLRHALEEAARDAGFAFVEEDGRLFLDE